MRRDEDNIVATCAAACQPSPVKLASSRFLHGTRMPSHSTHRLTRQIVIAMLAGIVLGVALNLLGEVPWIQNFVLDGLLQVVGSVFVAALKMMVVPLVFVSL
jgi:L-cystine uptake protein TcyP (sodium:dicarboxylate symporter family)